MHRGHQRFRLPTISSYPHDACARKLSLSAFISFLAKNWSHVPPEHRPKICHLLPKELANFRSFQSLTMSQHRKLVLTVVAVVLCAVGAILPFALASNAEHDEDANALRKIGDLVQTQGTVAYYAIGAWTNIIDMTLETELDSADAAILAYHVCSELKIPLHRPWTLRVYKSSGQKVAVCEMNS